MADEPLRLVVFVDQFPELSETFIAAELQMLRELGHDVAVESLARAPNPNPSAAVGLSVRYLDDDSRGARLLSMAWLALRHPLGCIRDLLSRRRWSSEEDVLPLRRLAPVARRVASGDRVHLHAHFGALAALAAMRVAGVLGLPYSLATHGYDIFQLPRNLREKHARAAFAVTDCDYSRDWLRSRHGAERIHRIVLGVDASQFQRTAPYPGGRVVLAVARLVEKKGLLYLIEAAASVDARFLIVGDGPLRDELERAAGGNVEFLGARGPDEIRSLLEEADLLAMPCVVAANGDRDTMPVVVKEALAMEVPVVATDEVGLPEVVHEGWGRLVPPRDSAALARAITDLLSLPPERRASMGRAGREFVLRECDLRTETERLVDLLRIC